MQITLVRHAKVLINSNKKVDITGFREWLKNYDIAPIDTTLPKNEVVNIIKNSNYIATSSLKRAKESLKIIGFKANEESAIFKELEVVTPNIKLIKLSPKNWLILFRILMIFGLKDKQISLKNAKSRAKKASNHLIQLAHKHNNITLLAHGAINHLIAKELEKEGFKLINKIGKHSNWSCKIYKI
jgi:broad specificity phosphatase PhoE